MSSPGKESSLRGRGPAIMAFPERHEHFEWIDAQSFEQAGILLTWFQPSLREDDGARAEPSSLDALRDVINRAQPDACILLGDGVLGRVVWALSDLAGVPVLALITTAEQLKNLPRRVKAKPDVFFIGNPDLLPAALRDDRYGSTLLSIGHPGANLEEGPSAVEARQRLLQGIERWWRDDLVSPTPDLSIVVPAYREAGNLPAVCQRLLDAIEGDCLDAEILLVDDASPDETYRVAMAQMWKSPRIRALTKEPPRGMGNAIRYGVEQARAPFVAITMADGSDEVSRIPEMLRKVRDEGYGLAIGSRYRVRANYQAVPMLYRFWSAIFRYTAWLIVGLRLRDYTNAFRVFRRDALDDQGLEGGGFEISPEITFKAWFATGRVAEVDVRHLKRGAGQSSFSFLRAGPGYGRMLLKAFVCRLTGRWFVLDW